MDSGYWNVGAYSGLLLLAVRQVRFGHFFPHDRYFSPDRDPVFWSFCPLKNGRANFDSFWGCGFAGRVVDPPGFTQKEKIIAT